MGNNIKIMQQKFGEIIELFAYGHPFLNGNGRTMLLVHIELFHCTGFSIAWHNTSKIDYLTALSQEIDRPGKGILNQYLLQYKITTTDRVSWEDNIAAIQGLDGFDNDTQVGEDLSDSVVAEKYRNFEQQRSYRYSNTTSSDE